MKKLTLLIILSFSTLAYTKDLIYQVQENDQIGVILLSLGHLKLWSKDGKINQFKRQKIKYPSKIWNGMFLKVAEDNIVFRKNVIISGNRFKFVKKINTIPEYYQLAKEENTDLDQTVKSNTLQIEALESKETIIEKSKKNVDAKPIHSLNLYPGIGLFSAVDTENDREVITKTSTGTQPLLQLKGIYSTDLFGSLSIDLLSKKIFNKQFSFPVNIDYRLQFVPKWNIADSFKLALSHSTLRHSYVGKSTDQEIAYDLKSNFIGIGLVVPRDNFWFEMYVEKAYSGETTSKEKTIKANKGLRLDTELVYPFFNRWKILPGLNYYQLKDSDLNYKFHVFEARLVMALEFEL